MAGRKSSRPVVEEFDYEAYQDSLQMERTFNSDVDYPEGVALLEEQDDDEEVYGLEEGDEEEEEYDDLEAQDLLQAEDTLDTDLQQAEQESDLDDDQIETLISRVDMNDVVRATMSFDDLVPKKKPRTGVINQRKEKKYQHGLLVIREAVTLTPASCKRTDCMYDAARACGFKKDKDTVETKLNKVTGLKTRKILKRGTFWDSVPQGKRKLVLSALKKHVTEKHTHQDESMFDEADRPASWLTPGIMLP
jgi:hypothetical protein